MINLVSINKFNYLEDKFGIISYMNMIYLLLIKKFALPPAGSLFCF